MMQSQKSKLTLHTSIIPNKPDQTQEKEEQPVEWKVLPHPQSAKKVRRLRKISLRRAPKQAAPWRTSAKRTVSAGEKLLRNSAVACALLLTILALRNVDQPWTQQAADGIRRVVTMRIDLDESLGRLNFVRNLMPDTALVFWNMGSEGKTYTPVMGMLVHEFDPQQPWQEYSCSPKQEVFAVEAGQVTAVGQGASEDWTVLVDHDDGAQTVYAYLGQAIVKVGQRVEVGTQIGVTGDEENSRLYFEYRIDGVAQDPNGTQGSSNP